MKCFFIISLHTVEVPRKNYKFNKVYTIIYYYISLIIVTLLIKSRQMRFCCQWNTIIGKTPDNQNHIESNSKNTFGLK